MSLEPQGRNGSTVLMHYSGDTFLSWPGRKPYANHLTEAPSSPGCSSRASTEVNSACNFGKTTPRGNRDALAYLKRSINHFGG